MRRKGDRRADIPYLNSLQINEQSSQLGGLVGVWNWNTSRYQSIIRDMIGVNDATLNGAYAWQETDNPIGSGTYGAGGNGGGSKVYANAGNATALQVTATGLTVCIWTRLYQAMGGLNFPGLIGKGDSDSTTLGSYLLYLAGSKLNYLDWSGSARKDSLTGATTLEFQTTYHFAATWLPSTRASIFVQGIRDATTTTSVPATLDNPAYSFLIGTNQGGGTLDKYSHRGVIHEARLYNRALTDDEVYQLYDPPTRWDLYRSPQRLFGHPFSGASAPRSFPLIMG